jgi:hypothetical protein
MNGLQEGFSRMWNSFKSIFVPPSAEKQAELDQQKAVADTHANDSVLQPILNITGLSGIKDSIDWLILAVVGLLMATVIFRR